MSSSTFKQLEELIKNAASDPSHAKPSDVLAEIGCPTTSVAILEDGQISSLCASTIGHNPDTLFQACSISKVIAGLAMMKLVELGHFSLDDKVWELLPDNIVKLMTQDARTESLVKLVTIRQLMSHTAGISVHGFPGYPDSSKVPSISQIFEGHLSANTQPIKMHTLPGLDFMYSGGGITVLQCAAEHVMKMTFPEIMEKYVFKPLNMTRSCYVLPKNEANVAHAHYHGYYPAENKWHTLPELAAGGLWTTPTDLLKAARAVQESLDGTRPDTLLKKQTAELMLTLVKEPYGLFWCLNGFSFWHGGDNLPGYKAFLIGYADLPWNEKEANKTGSNKEVERMSVPKSCGISVMTNSFEGHKIISKVLAALSFIKKWPEPDFKWAGDANPSTPLPAALEAPAQEEWEAWAGDDWEGGWLVSQDSQGHPTAGLHKSGTIKLFPAAVPPKHYDGGRKTIDFIMEGIEVMLRFGWKGSERVIEVHNCGNGKVDILHRKKS